MGRAGAQTLIKSTDWTGGAFGSTTAGAAGTTTGAGDGWIDNFGGLMTAGSANKLTVAGGSGFYNGGKYLLRPTADNVRDGQLVTVLPAQASGDIVYYAVHRYVGNNTEYLIGYNLPTAATSPNAVQMFRNVAGGIGGVGTPPTFTAPAATTDVLRITTAVTGASPATLSISVYDVTTSTLLGSYSAADASTPTSLQVAGQTGVGTNGAVSVKINSMSVYNTAGAATSYTLTGPATGATASASSPFTLTPNGTYTGTITPAVSGITGTFNPASLTWAGDNSVKTFTFTPSSQGAGTISASSSPGLTNPGSVTYTSTAPLPYAETDATAPAYGQNVMVLVPNSFSAVPYNAANPTTLVIYAHGAGETERGMLTDSLKSATVTAMINAGYILAGSAAHGTQNWGNQASVDDYADLYNYCAQNYNVGKVIVWGQSMGGLDSLLTLAENKVPNVVGWIGTYPVCNLANLYSLGTYTGAINTAYAITGTAPATYANQTYGHDPSLKWGAAFRSLPMRFYASPGDSVVPKANNTDVLAALVTTSSREHSVVVCSGNHGDPSHFQPSDYLAFMSRCLASPVSNAGQLGSVGGTKRRIQ